MTTTAVRAMTREDLEREIQDRNARFDALSPAERRVAIALDVLAQSKAGRFIADMGTYVEYSGEFDEDDNGQAWVDSLPECYVCAVGAGVVSAAGLFNRCDGLTLEQLGDGAREGTDWRGNHYPIGKAREYLTAFFDADQIDLMEAAFECSHRFAEDHPKVGRAVAYGNSYENSGKRLEAIWKNVAKNGGEFRP